MDEMEQLGKAIAKLEAVKATLGRVVFAREEGDLPSIGYLYAQAELEFDADLGDFWDGTVVGGEFSREDFAIADGFELLASSIDGQLAVLRTAAGSKPADLATAVDRAPHLAAALELAASIIGASA